MPWQLIMVFQNSLAAVFAINSRIIARHFRRATLPLNLIVFATIAISGFVYALCAGFNQVSVSRFWHFGGLFIFAGLCFAATNIVSYIVFQYVDAAIASLLATLNIVAAVILSTLIIKEGLSLRQIIGSVLVLSGMQLVLMTSMSAYRHKRLWVAIALSLVSSLFFAFATTTEKYLLNHVNLPTYLVFGWGFQFLGVLTVSIIFGKALRAHFSLLKNSKFWRLALPAGALRMTAGLLFIISLKLSNNLSIISVYSGLKVIIAALLGSLLLHEREHLWRRLQAAAVATIGIATMLWK